MVAGIREAQAALGDGRKAGPSEEERQEMYTLARRSLIVTRDLPAGTVLERDMLTVKRPGFGIAPKHLELVLGRALQGGRRGRRHPHLGDGLTEPPVVVVADAGEGAGLGHMSRSGAVAIALRRLRVGDVPCFGLEARRPLELDGQVWVPLRSLHELPIPSVLVLDSYRVPVHTVQGLARDLRLVLMHDLLPVPDQTALVLSLDTDAGPQAIDGLRDACLRPPFWDVPARSHRERLERVLVTTGGGDPGGAGLRIARAAATPLRRPRLHWFAARTPIRARPRESRRS